MTSRFTQRILDNAGKFDFVGAHFACEKDRFSHDNPSGFVNLGSAQNFLQPGVRRDRIAAIRHHADDVHYQPFAGTIQCRTSIAGYLQSLADTPVDPDDVVIGNGIISLLESLAVALLDDEDYCLVPTPVFPGLVAALSLRVRSKIAWMHTDTESNFRLTPAALQQELARLAAKKTSVKAILLCSPGNPIGQVFTADQMKRFAELADEFNCALIVDEVYASSCFENVEFFSAIATRGTNIYVLGGLSKDFGLAGYATGWLHGTNAGVMQAMRKQSHLYRLPTLVQRAVETFLEPDWRTSYLRDHRRLLTQKFAHTQAALALGGIEVSCGEAGLCMWLDLREHLGSDDVAGEMEIYQFMLQRQRVHISPGSGFHSQQFGFFRLCFSQDHATLTEGIRRIVVGLQPSRSHQDELTWV